jgi:hypothetical protein
MANPTKDILTVTFIGAGYGRGALTDGFARMEPGVRFVLAAPV